MPPGRGRVRSDAPGGEINGAYLMTQATDLATATALRDALGYGHLAGIVHGVPGFRYKIGWMGIEITRPKEEGFRLGRAMIEAGNGSFGDPGIVMEFLGNIPPVALGRCRPGRVTRRLPNR